MKVKITKKVEWTKYSDMGVINTCGNVGEIYKVIDNEDREFFTLLEDKDMTTRRIIWKSDCIVLEEPSEKLCSTCFYENDEDCVNDECEIGTLSGWKPIKLANEKPKVEKVKKYKYVCNKCSQGKCKLVNENENVPRYCQYGYTCEWKLKGEN
jgi:hypothetical protein